MTRTILRFLKDQSGATAIEYGLIVALVAIAIIGAMTAFSGSVIAMFNNVAETTGDAMAGAGEEG